MLKRYKLLAALGVLPSVAFAQFALQETSILVLILVALLIILAGLPVFKKMKV